MLFYEWSAWGHFGWGRELNDSLSHSWFLIDAPVVDSGLSWCIMSSWWHIFPDSALPAPRHWAKKGMKESDHLWPTALPTPALGPPACVKPPQIMLLSSFLYSLLPIIAEITRKSRCSSEVQGFKCKDILAAILTDTHASRVIKSNGGRLRPKLLSVHYSHALFPFTS